MILFYILLILVVGGVLFGAYQSDFITNRYHFGAIALVVLLISAPLGIHVANELSVGEQIGGWNQFINGSVIRTGVDTHVCGYNLPNCHTYECDPYTVSETNFTYDDKGNITGSDTTYHTEYNDCPYVTVEYDYYAITQDFETRTVHTDVGVLDENPQVWIGCSEDCNNFVPAYQKGPGPRWKDLTARLAAGEVPSNTRITQYDNFILASTANLLRARSTDIKKYKKAGLLIDHTAGIPEPVYDDFNAIKFQTIGVSGVNVVEWSKALGKFNAVLGMNYQGDMHIVAIPASKVSSPDNYASALTAYWQSPAVDKWAIPKNAIVVVIGLSKDNTEIEWARAKTGMPHGNGAMLQALNTLLPGKFTVDRVLGENGGQIKGNKVDYKADTSAIIPKITTKDYPFERACMANCSDKGDHGRGFISLEDDVKPDIGLWSYAIVFVICLAVFGGMLAGCWRCSASFYRNHLTTKDKNE